MFDIAPPWSTPTATLSTRHRGTHRTTLWCGSQCAQRRFLELAPAHVPRRPACDPRATGKRGSTAVHRAAAGGYTQVCEFHYLHNAPDGQGVCRPAGDVAGPGAGGATCGDRLTLLPTLYMRSGFAAGLREDQGRFAPTPDSVMRLVQSLQSHTARLAQVNVGVAVHSLRGRCGGYQRRSEHLGVHGRPAHPHPCVGTNARVQDCLAHTGQRPIEWLLSHLPVDAHWNLVRATTPHQQNWQRPAPAAQPS